jgi:hypothetical protein
MKCKPRLEQYIPRGSRAAFSLVESRPGETYFEITLREPPGYTSGYEPIFHYYPPKKGSPFTIQQLANAGAGELAEARGIIGIVHVQDGLPIFIAYYVSNGRQVLCVRSSDPTRASQVVLVPKTFSRERKDARV